MHFLKTLFWVVLAVVAVIFSLRNWAPVPILLWGGLTADVKLPILLIISALIGFLPTYAVHRTKLWRLKRRIDNLERNAPMEGTPTRVPENVDPQPVILP
jgi:putative membrane protein